MLHLRKGIWGLNFCRCWNTGAAFLKCRIECGGIKERNVQETNAGKRSACSGSIFTFVEQILKMIGYKYDTKMYFSGSITELQDFSVI